MSMTTTFLLSVRKYLQPPSHPWTATIEKLNMYRPPTRRDTKAGIRRSRPITRAVSRRCHGVSSVDKQTGVNTANLIQLMSRGSGKGSFIARSSLEIRANFVLVNVTSIRNKALFVRGYVDNLERYGRRSFSRAGPTLRNALPEDLRLRGNEHFQSSS